MKAFALDLTFVPDFQMVVVHTDSSQHLRPGALEAVQDIPHLVAASASVQDLAAFELEDIEDTLDGHLQHAVVVVVHSVVVAGTSDTLAADAVVGQLEMANSFVQGLEELVLDLKEFVPDLKEIV